MADIRWLLDRFVFITFKIRDMNELPVYKGWTVDFRLREFRFVYENKEIAFVSFESNEGMDLLIQMSKNYLEKYA